MSDSRPPLTTTTSILPAMLVGAIAVGTLLIFLVINVVTSRTVTPSAPSVAVVGGLKLDASNHALGACQQPGTPPANISGALILPVATTARGAVSRPNAGAGDFTCSARFVTRSSSAEVLGFYRAHLESQGWTLFSSGSSHAKAQLLFQKAGADTFYWVAGVSVSSSNATGVTWTYRIYQNSSMI